jgi:hypothetical protein
MGCVVKKLHEPVAGPIACAFAGPIACAFLEKLCRGFHYSNLFRHFRSDPLVQGDSVLVPNVAPPSRFAIFNNSGGRRD